MAYGSGAEMMFGTAKYPVTTKRGIEIGGGFVHPRGGSPSQARQ